MDDGYPYDMPGNCERRAHFLGYDDRGMAVFYVPPEFRDQVGGGNGYNGRHGSHDPFSRGPPREGDRRRGGGDPREYGGRHGGHDRFSPDDLPPPYSGYRRHGGGDPRERGGGRDGIPFGDEEEQIHYPWERPPRRGGSRMPGGEEGGRFGGGEGGPGPFGRRGRRQRKEISPELKRELRAMGMTPWWENEQPQCDSEGRVILSWYDELSEAQQSELRQGRNR